MSVNTEYQHFIPQFLVKNYAHPFKCSVAEDKGKKTCKIKCKHEKGKYPNDLVVNSVNFTTTPFQIETRSVKRIFGSPGMYHDPAKAQTNEQRRIERMFGKMESQASTIFRRIVKSHESGEVAIMLTRDDRDVVRKFLFLLKYRGAGFYRRFYHGDPENYYADDRDRLLEYMTKKGFSTPRDVWFHNLEAIMRLKMDPDNEWIMALREQMFPDDASWFISHVQMYYMAICTPSEAEAEFILTENCYNVFEGPNTYAYDRITGKLCGGGHGGFHEFAIISPRLLLVLRSSALPNPQEDRIPEVRQSRENFYWESFGQIFGSDTHSLLKDLPVRKAENSYTEVIAGRRYLVAGHDGSHRRSDRFYFHYHLVGPTHVQIINNIFLENAYRNNSLAFQSQENFIGILERYIDGPCVSFKVVGGDDSDIRYLFLRGLETLAKTLGSRRRLVWRAMDAPTVEIDMAKHKKFHSMQDPATVSGVTDDQNLLIAFLGLYSKLGSSFYNDLAQAGKMLHFENTVVVEGMRYSAMVGSRNYCLLSAMFKGSSCAKYWLYLKLVRKGRISLYDGTQDIVDLFAVDDIRQGPEDVFVKTCQLYDSDTLNELMHVTVHNDLDHRSYNIENIWASAAGNLGDAARQLRIHHLVFSRPDSIRCCGIPKVEQLADEVERSLRPRGVRCGSVELPYASEDDHLELMIRILVRSKFASAMAGDAEEDDLRELEDVFFTLTFPTPPFTITRR